MFGIGRRKSQGALVRSELGESLGHLKRAANHAAYGVGATVGPRVQAARDSVSPTAARVRDTATTGWSSTMAALAPLAVAAAGGARQAGSAARKAKAKNMMMQNRKKQQAARKRRSMLRTGLLAAGAVAGVAGAMAVRRRRDQQQWEEYDPSRSLVGAREETDTIVVGTPDGPTVEGAGRQAAGQGGEPGAGAAVGGAQTDTIGTPSGNPRH
ncbi:hypothetical protein [Micromonospora echinofusca]|uniref:Uncharacterized protein n=1 Tax=Micromonospora echinofusca TaxID=47858 RepID=A0ABS3VLB2_MICEH|nr:hypothetical protein [Micromonospora echinofusca]MBO4205305.1 hypothetical protein [Micromonospora echinofusca]